MFCLRYLLDGTQEQGIYLEMGHYWFMLRGIADRILRKIPSSAVIRLCHSAISLVMLGY